MWMLSRHLKEWFQELSHFCPSYSLFFRGNQLYDLDLDRALLGRLLAPSQKSIHMIEFFFMEIPQECWQTLVPKQLIPVYRM